MENTTGRLQTPLEALGGAEKESSHREDKLGKSSQNPEEK